MLLEVTWRLLLTAVFPSYFFRLGVPYVYLGYSFAMLGLRTLLSLAHSFAKDFSEGTGRKGKDEVRIGEKAVFVMCI